MIKKFFILFCLIIFCSSITFAEVFQYVAGDFDWAILSQKEKNERVSNIFKILFPTGQITNYSKKEFRELFKNNLKDKDAKIHYDAMIAGYKEYKNVKLEPYFYKNTGCLYMYALQYKNDLSKTFYYTVLGNLKYVDLRYGDYVNAPCYIKKYDKNGKFQKAVYIQTKDIMYTYSSKGEFEGIQYKSTLYTH